MTLASLKDLDLAALRQDLPAYGLVADDIGTVVQVYADREAFEAEFVTTGGRTLAVQTFSVQQVARVPSGHVLHICKFATS
jgi:hypothetical protein